MSKQTILIIFIAKSNKYNNYSEYNANKAKFQLKWQNFFKNQLLAAFSLADDKSAKVKRNKACVALSF
jgi:hypothetical protein